MTAGPSHGLFGYGSLINEASRRRSFRCERTHPARMTGFERVFAVADREIGASGLGLVPRVGAPCTGVVIHLEEAELLKADDRELAHGYERVPLESRAVEILGEGTLPEGPLWTYVSVDPRSPSDACPIVQTYLDVILAGCLAVGAPFAEEFVRTTSGWEGPWIDDRAHPRYVRALRQPAAERDIDALLSRLVPDAFENRRPAGHARLPARAFDADA